MASIDKINAKLDNDQKYILYILSKNENEAIKEIGRKYKELFDQIDKELSALYRKLDPKNITFAEANKYNRLKTLLANTAQSLEEFHKALSSGLDKIAVANAWASQFGFQWSIERAVNLSLKFTLNNKIATDIVKQSPFYFLAKNDLYNKNLKEIRSILNQGFIQRKTYVEASKDLQEVINKNYSQARRIVRTENHRIYELAHNEEFLQAKKMGIDTKMQLVSVIDDRTRDQSLSMHRDFSNDEGKFQYPDGNYYIPGSTGNPKWDIHDRERSIQIVDSIEPKKQYISSQGKVLNKNQVNKIINDRLDLKNKL